jgi:uncharacterized protein YabN with tetrapyrrole methylase and pyrophosphatase domain
VQAFRLQEKAAAVRFDWSAIEPVIEKVREEIRELEASSDETLSHEFGDLLFAVVNWARWAKIDPESALRQANARFRQRFGYIEGAAQTAGKPLETMSPEEMDGLWEAAKREGL